MSDGTEHEFVAALLGVHALDATSPDEAVRIEEHVATCSQCRDELDEYRVTASVLGTETEPIPEGLWGRISDEMDSLRPQRTASSIVALDEVRERRSRPRRRLTSVPITSVAAAVVAVLAIGWVSALDRADSLQSKLSHSTSAVALAVALHSPGSRTLELATSTGTRAADVVVTPGGAGYVYLTSMSALPKNETYQLWSINDNQPISIGLLGDDPSIAAFSLGNIAGPLTLAVTVEPRNGVSAPTTTPIATGVLRA